MRFCMQSNPLTTSATEFFESGSIKASKFTIESIKRIKSLESHSDTTQSGLDFLDDFKSKFNYNEPSVELDEQALRSQPGSSGYQLF